MGEGQEVQVSASGDMEDQSTSSSDEDRPPEMGEDTSITIPDDSNDVDSSDASDAPEADDVECMIVGEERAPQVSGRYVTVL